MLIEAFEEQVAPAFPRAKLVIAGTNNSNSPGYIEGLNARYGNHPNIEFRGYVEEHDIPEMFGTSSFMVMPYTSATGASGVANLAAAYGVPIICSDIPDFREMGDSGGLAIKFYPVGNKAALAKNMLDLLRDESDQHEMAEQNFSAAMRMTMPQVVRQYLRAFDVHQRTRALDPLRRFRRIPSWIPSRSSLARAVGSRTAPWS
jgi:glycosyltransferase involved in cell wall biosynthesis